MNKSQKHCIAMSIKNKLDINDCDDQNQKPAANGDWDLLKVGMGQHCMLMEMLCRNQRAASRSKKTNSRGCRFTDYDGSFGIPMIQSLHSLFRAVHSFRMLACLFCPFHV